MPMRNVTLGRERLILSRMFVTIAQVEHTCLDLDLHSWLVGMLVSIGTLEDKPLNASNLANILISSGTTVLRKLAVLVEHGAVRKRGTTYYVSAEWLNAHVAHIPPIVKAVTKAAAELAALRPKPQARDESMLLSGRGAA